jgi:hypothetical protein
VLRKLRTELGDLPSRSGTGLLLVHGTYNTANKKPSIDQQSADDTNKKIRKGKQI